MSKNPDVRFHAYSLCSFSEFINILFLSYESRGLIINLTPFSHEQLLKKYPIKSERSRGFIPNARSSPKNAIILKNRYFITNAMSTSGVMAGQTLSSHVSYGCFFSLHDQGIFPCHTFSPHALKHRKSHVISCDEIIMKKG